MKRLFIESGADGVRIALTDGGRLVELYIDPSDDGSWVGRVIVGRLKTILPGQFAFVDIGSDKNAFMNLRAGHGLKAGQPVLVQVYKDAARSKGMYAGLEISLRGLLIVLFEDKRGDVGVSRKITDDKEAKRLRGIVRELLPKGFSAIARTNAAGQDKPAIEAEIKKLRDLHTQIKNRAEFARPPTVLYPAPAENPLMTDLLSEDLAEIHISGETGFFEAMRQSIRDLIPGLESRILHADRDVFGINGIIKQISAALEKEIRLPCGGYVTFEETEACVVIDVNTGGNVGKKDYKTTVLETNIEAAVLIAAQIRLRNLSGIIIIDFIDMPDEADKNALMAALGHEVKKDRIRAEIIGMVGLGMVQLTRRKTRPPLSFILETNCPRCGGKGRIRRQEAEGGGQKKD